MRADGLDQYGGLTLLALGKREEPEQFFEVTQTLGEGASFEPNREG